MLLQEQTHILGLQELLTAKGIDAKIHLDFDHVSRVDVLRYINLSREVFFLIETNMIMN
jgi:hypothetical protein